MSAEPSRRARSRRWGVAAAGLLLLGAVGLVTTRSSAAPEIGVASRSDLTLTVDVEGELAAVRSREIGVPNVPEVDFKIAFLAPEGATVKAGERIAAFDTEVLERRLADKESELAEAEKRLEQRE